MSPCRSAGGLFRNCRREQPKEQLYQSAVSSIRAFTQKTEIRTIATVSVMTLMVFIFRSFPSQDAAASSKLISQVLISIPCCLAAYVYIHVVDACILTKRVSEKPDMTFRWWEDYWTFSVLEGRITESGLDIFNDKLHSGCYNIHIL